MEVLAVLSKSDELAWNKIFEFSSGIISVIDLAFNGQPLFALSPGSFGQLSSLSRIPSPSSSSQGQPLLSGSPTSSGQLSTSFKTPSPSESSDGQPLFSFEPYSFGQASYLSITPSLSVSLSLLNL